MTFIRKYCVLVASLSTSGFDLSSAAAEADALALASLRSEFISRREDTAIFNCHNIQAQGKFLPFVK
jgi:hypothetical protein